MAQVYAYLLTRGNRLFQRKFLAVKISKTLARMGIKVSKFTVARILKEHGVDPIDDYRPKWKKWMARGHCGVPVVREVSQSYVTCRE